MSWVGHISPLATQNLIQGLAFYTTQIRHGRHKKFHKQDCAGNECLF